MFFITHKKIFLGLGILFVIVSTVILAVFGLKQGIDFTGGSLTEVTYDERPAQDELEAAIAELNLGGVSVRGSVDEAGKDAYFIQTRNLSEAERVNLQEKATMIGTSGEVTRFTSIGPVVGQELKDKAVWAVGGVALIIVLYVAFAFSGIGTPVSSWVYGLVTIVSLAHDVLVATAFMSILGVLTGAEVDILFVMALLAILGYSVNDTIVIFDRVRDNLKQNRTERKITRSEAGSADTEEIEYTLTAPYRDIVGNAISESMGRSINTSLTTFISLIALYILGGSVTANFALILMVGVALGTFSSICLAAPMVVAYEEYQAKKNK